MNKRDVIVTALLTLLVVAGCIGAVAVVVSSYGDDQSSIVVDQAVVSEWEHAVAPGLDDLNALDDLPGLSPDGRAKVTSCSIDDGELFDLWAGLAWTADELGDDELQVSSETAEGATSIVRQLVAKGWIIDERSSILGEDLPPGFDFDTVSMHRHASGTDLELTMQIHSRGAYAYLYYSQGRPACHLAT